MEEKYALYDSIIEQTLTNLFSLSKGSNSIQLRKFKPRQKDHLCIYEICKLVQNLYNTDIYIEEKFLKSLLLRLKFKEAYFDSKLPNAIEVDSLITHVELTNNMPNIFKEIYDMYYKNNMGENNG